MLMTLNETIAQEIAANFIALQHNNQARFKELRHYATAGLAVVFDQVPELLSLNHPNKPGYVDNPATPSGVKMVERQLWRPLADRVVDFGTSNTSKKPVIESLFLIGSAGSVGHTETSDLDYWVCYSPNSMTTREFELFQRKLSLLCDWARTEQGTEANFYPINLELIAKGCITHLQEVSKNEHSTPHSLLEEFYRTFIFVAGSLPLWPVIPMNTDENTYLNLCTMLVTGEGDEYVDLGFPKPPSPQEALTTALNLAYNSEHSLFKGLIKITALLEYVETDFKCSPLCYDVKQAILTTNVHGTPTDPYIITIERVMDYGARWLTVRQLDLLRVSVVLKILGARECNFTPSPQDSPKTKALLKWTQAWGWEPDRLKHLIAYNSWAEREKFGLDECVLNAITSIYARISQCILTHHKDQVNPHDGDLAHLTARLMMRSKGLPSTVETLSYQQHNRLDSSEIILRHLVDKNLWSLHLATEASISEDNLIYQHQRIARVGAWLAHNNLYATNSKLFVQSTDNKTKITVDFMGNFITKIQKIFPPIDFEREQEVEWSVGGHSLIMVVFNAEQVISSEGDLLEVDFIFRTGWGEMRHHHLRLDKSGSLADKNLQIVQAILNVYPDAQPENLTMFYFNSVVSPQLDKATRNIRGALAATKRSLPSAHPPDKMRLDL